MSNTWFRLMALEFKIRDYRHPRKEIIDKAELKPGFQVLDYGCGPGGYVLPVSQTIGSTGKLYALDVLPIAIGMVKQIMAKNKLTNVETILSQCDTGLKNEALDAVLLYDVFHGLEDQTAVLNGLHRVLKPNGLLSFSDHHMQEEDIVTRITASGQFKLQRKNQHTYSFIKQS